MAGSSSTVTSCGPEVAGHSTGSIQFELENIVSFQDDTMPLVHSPSSTSGRFRFRLKVYPKGTLQSRGVMGVNVTQNAGKGRFLSVFIEADPQDCLFPEWSFPAVEYSVTLVNRLPGKANYKKKDTFSFDRNKCDRGWHDFYHLSKIMNKDHGWLGPNNSVLLRASVDVDMSNADWEAMPLPEAKAQQSLGLDFSMLWSSGWQSDVTLRAGGRELKAHSLVLSARSLVFKQMFNNGMAETSTKTVDISDIDPDVLSHVCGFMYSGVVQEAVWENDDVTCGLMRAASKYEVNTLMELCASRAAQRVCVENVAEWLRAATELNAEKLKAHCISFAAKSLSEVQATPGWERLMQDKNMVFEVTPLLLQTISPPPMKRARQD